MEPEHSYSEESFGIEFPKVYRKVNQIFMISTPQPSFVYLATSSSGKDSVCYYEPASKELFEHHFESPVSSAYMMAHGRLLLLNTFDNELVVWKFIEQSRKSQQQLTVKDKPVWIQRIPFQFMQMENQFSMIYGFRRSRSVCIVQTGSPLHSYIKLNYYDITVQEFRNSAVTLTPRHEFMDQENWTSQFTTERGDESSMVLWFKGRADKFFEFSVFSVTQTGESLRHYKISTCNCPLFEPPPPDIKVGIIRMWRFSPDSLIAVCISNRSHTGKEPSLQQSINNKYIIDLTECTIRQTKFVFANQEEYLIDCMAINDEYSMFRTFGFEPGGAALDTPIYYVHNPTESTVRQRMWKTNSHCSYEFLGDQSASFYETICCNFEPTSAQIRKINIRQQTGQQAK